jgi:transcriptional regulator with XRE-family HTH domain
MEHEMSKPSARNYSPITRDAAALLGEMIHAARIRRRMTAAELGERAGVSRGLVSRVEAGDMGVALGAAFEMAAVLGVPLFDAAPERVSQALESTREVNALLPKRAFQLTAKVDDAF